MSLRHRRDTDDVVYVGQSKVVREMPEGRVDHPRVTGPRIAQPEWHPAKLVLPERGNERSVFPRFRVDFDTMICTRTV